MTSSNALYSLPAPAKLNLFLHVIGQRKDKKHLLESVFILLDRKDTIDLELLENGDIERTGDIVGNPEEDLCVRAARLLKDTYHIERGVRIRVHKTIPSGAGMGGGSSDAATTLIGLNTLWKLNLPRRTLCELGVRLGADVPFFIFGRNAFVEGIGEVQTPVSIPKTRFFVIWPGKSVSTAKIFASPALTRDTESTKIQPFIDAVKTNWPQLFGHNDLEPVAVSYEPEIANALQWLTPYTEPRMTGSGSAVFSVAHSGEANMVQTVFTGMPDSWVGFITESLSEHPLAQWLDD